MLQSSKIFLEKTEEKKPSIGVILGSGLTKFFEEKDIIITIPYNDLPGFPQPTVKGHSGKLIFGSINNYNVVCMYGRSHIYEGHDPQTLAIPIRTLKEVGCDLLIITNAAGSLNSEIPPGSLMNITDHINWSGFNPLIGENKENFGPRFNDMSNAYDKYYRQQLSELAQSINQKLFEGVYCMYSGPSFETPAEINALKTIGGDAVGMSTVPEVIVANHCSLPTIAISIITNYAAGLSNTPLSHKETLEQAALAENNILSLIKNFIKVVKFDDPSRNN